MIASLCTGGLYFGLHFIQPNLRLLVRQEFWGLLLAHHVVRKLMLEAALVHERPPDTLSFKHSLSLMRRKLPASGALPPRAVPEVVAEAG